MKAENIALLVAAALVAAVSAVVTSLFVGGGAEPPGADRSADERVLQLERKLAELEAELDSVRELGEPTESIVGDAPHVSRGDLEPLILDILGDRGIRAPEPKPEHDVAALFDALLDPGTSWQQRERIWQQLRESGQLDDMIREFEQRAQDYPNDAGVATELAQAYFQKMLSLSGPAAGRYGARAAKELERALEIDATHWDARFQLASHYRNAGMNGDAMQHAQILIDQQRQAAPEERHAHAYLLLGNLHMSQGRTKDAEKIFIEGARLYPDQEALQERLESLVKDQNP